MKFLIAWLVVFAVHHWLTETIITIASTANEQTQLVDSRNRGPAPKFIFVQEEAEH